jgi:hypothetical protein
MNQMNLKKNDQDLLDQLQQFANTLFSVTPDLQTVKNQLKPSMDSFEQKTGGKASLREENGAIVVSGFDLKKDDLRTTANQDQTLVSMKAKSLGVSIDVKVVKGGVKFTNGQISESLREAADVIDRMQGQMYDYPSSDWDRETGLPADAKADSPEQGDGDDNQNGAGEAQSGQEFPLKEPAQTQVQDQGQSAGNGIDAHQESTSTQTASATGAAIENQNLHPQHEQQPAQQSSTHSSQGEELEQSTQRQHEPI